MTGKWQAGDKKSKCECGHDVSSAYAPQPWVMEQVTERRQVPLIQQVLSFLGNVAKKSSWHISAVSLPSYGELATLSGMISTNRREAEYASYCLVRFVRCVLTADLAPTACAGIVLAYGFTVCRLPDFCEAPPCRRLPLWIHGHVVCRTEPH